MSENTTAKKPLWVKLLIIVLSVVLGLSVLLLGAIGFFTIPVKDYYNNSSKEFVIPGLNNGFVPQGFCYDQNEDWFLTTGYMNNGSKSPIYIIDNGSKTTVKTVYLEDSEGKPYTGHCGGIAFFSNFVYIADGGKDCLVVFNYNDIKRCKDNQSVQSIGTFSTKFSDEDYISPSFVEVYGNKLIVGEFYRKKNYETLSSHHLETPSGDQNTAIALEFTLYASFTSTFGINPTPQKAYSLPNQVQGISYHKGEFYLSTSWGLSFSQILVYDSFSLQTSKELMTFLNTDVLVYYLDSSSLIKQIKAPPMSEEMAVVDDKLLIMCKSASNKYIFGKFTGGKWCYATDLSKYGL